MQQKLIACEVGEAVVDVSLNVNMTNLRKLNLSLDDSVYLDKERKKLLDEFLSDKNPKITAGGSVSNTVSVLSSLYGDTAFIGNTGKDELGQIFFNDLRSNNILVSSNIFNDNVETSVCYVFVTPDAERTFAVFKDNSSHIKLDETNKDYIRSSNYLILEMYMAREINDCLQMEEAIKIAKKCNTKVVVSLSNQRIVKEYKKQVHNFVASADIVFANLYEAQALSNTSQVHLMIDHFLSLNDDKEYLITLGRSGAIYFKNGKAFYQPSFKVEPVDTTGAGDMFTASYLYGISAGLSIQESLKKACYMSSKVICQQGARYLGDIKSAFNEI